MNKNLKKCNLTNTYEVYDDLIIFRIDKLLQGANEVLAQGFKIDAFVFYFKEIGQTQLYASPWCDFWSVSDDKPISYYLNFIAERSWDAANIAQSNKDLFFAIFETPYWKSQEQLDGILEGLATEATGIEEVYVGIYVV